MLNMCSIDINNELKAHYSDFNGSAKQLTRDFSHMPYKAGFQIRYNPNSSSTNTVARQLPQPETTGILSRILFGLPQTIQNRVRKGRLSANSILGADWKKLCSIGLSQRPELYAEKASQRGLEFLFWLIEPLGIPGGAPEFYGTQFAVEERRYEYGVERIFQDALNDFNDMLLHRLEVTSVRPY
ncbi:hypothetical protein TNCV_727831 [Trichonephila clavipes]|nr:hypothetical protein TNCV_727831 [Trichonephila clavipes]